MPLSKNVKVISNTKGSSDPFHPKKIKKSYICLPIPVNASGDDEEACNNKHFVTEIFFKDLKIRN